MVIERKKYIDFLLKQKDKDIVKIITGIRRYGKSTLLFELFYKEIKKLGVSEEHIIKIALDNIINAELSSHLLHLINPSYMSYCQE